MDNTLTAHSSPLAIRNAKESDKSAQALKDYYTAQLLAEANGQPSTLSAHVLTDD